MRTVEYTYSFDNAYYDQEQAESNAKAKSIIYEGSDRLPSKMMLKIIKEAGWPTDWAYYQPRRYAGFHDPFAGQPWRYEIFSKLEKQLSAVIKTLHGEIKGKRILDLGCGAKQKTHESEMDIGKFDPWLARLLHALGAKVIGIDVGDLEAEKFKHFNLDLLIHNSLNIFPDHYFDIVHSSALYTSPELQFRVEGKAGEGSFRAAWKLARILLPQIKRILKPNGVYLLRELDEYLKIKSRSNLEQDHSPIPYIVTDNLV